MSGVAAGSVVVLSQAGLPPPLRLSHNMFGLVSCTLYSISAYYHTPLSTLSLSPLEISNSFI